MSLYRLLGVLTVLVTSSAGATSPLGAQDRISLLPTDTIPMDPTVRSGALPNGLRYLIRHNAWPEHRAELRLVVNVGSVQEDDDQRGLAHFVEHMAFNGTTHFARQELVDYIERIGMRFGAHLNAGTSFDETTYQLQVPTDTSAIVDTAFQILEDWAHGVTFAPDEVERERGVVIEEWRLGLGAEARMLAEQLPVLVRGSRYAERLPIGDRETLQTFDRDALLRFYRDWYRPDLMGVVVVGDIDVDRVEGLIQEHFAGLSGPTSPRPRVDETVPDHVDPLVAVATDREATNSRVTVYEKTTRQDELTVGAYRQRFLDAIDDGILNLRLFELTKQADPPFIGAGGGKGSLVRTVDMDVLGANVKDGGIERGLAATLAVAERVRRFGYTEGEFQRGQTEFVRGLERAYDDREKTPSASLASEYVSHLLTGEPVPGITYEYALARALVPTMTLEELNASAARRRSGQNRVILVNAPEKPDVPVPTEQALLDVFRQIQGSEMTAYADSVDQGPLVDPLPTPGAVVGETTDSALGTTTWTLGNGVRVILRPTDFKADELLFAGYSPGGTSVVPMDAFLNASLAPTLLGLGGLGRFDAISLEKRLAGKAVNVVPYIGMTQEGLRGGGSPKDMETLFQLIYLSVTAPRVDTVAFQGFRTNVRAALANRGSNPEAVFQDTLQVVLTDHNPLARPFSSSRVDELDLAQAYLAFRDRFGDAGDFTFVFVGRFTQADLRPLVEQYLATLPTGGRQEQWRDPGIHAPDGVVVQEVRKGVEPKSQTQLTFHGSFTYARETRDEMRWLAAVLDIRLRVSLREALGGTYGVNVGASPSRVPREEYTFSVSFGSAPERVQELVDAVFAEIDTLQQFGARSEDLEKVRESELRSREVSLTRNAYWLSQIIHSDQTGEPVTMLEDHKAYLTALSSERMQAAARRYLNQSQYIRVSLLPEASTAPTPN